MYLNSIRKIIILLSTVQNRTAKIEIILFTKYK